jgi:hypothetical protein
MCADYSLLSLLRDVYFCFSYLLFILPFVYIVLIFSCLQSMTDSSIFGVQYWQLIAGVVAVFLAIIFLLIRSSTKQAKSSKKHQSKKSHASDSDTSSDAESSGLDSEDERVYRAAATSSTSRSYTRHVSALQYELQGKMHTARALADLKRQAVSNYSVLNRLINRSAFVKFISGQPDISESSLFQRTAQTMTPQQSTSASAQQASQQRPIQQVWIKF